MTEFYGTGKRTEVSQGNQNDWEKTMNYYVVTGGAGFIGSHIVDALIAKGSGVMVFDDLSSGKRGSLPIGVPLIVGDVRDAPAVATALPAGTDTVFHLAAQIDVRRAVEEWLQKFEPRVAAIAYLRAQGPRRSRMVSRLISC